MTEQAANLPDENQQPTPIVPSPDASPPPASERTLDSVLNYFHAAIFEPISTIKKLSVEYSTQTKELWFEAFIVVVISGAIFGAVRAHKASELVYFISSGILDTALYWYVSSSILMALSKVMGVRKFTLKECGAITGISFAPLVLLGLLGCLAALPKVVYVLFLTLPVYWSLALLAISYRTALGVSYMRILIMAMVAPPILFLVYAFWIGSALLMIVGTLIRAS